MLHMYIDIDIYIYICNISVAESCKITKWKSPRKECRSKILMEERLLDSGSSLPLTPSQKKGAFSLAEKT